MNTCEIVYERGDVETALAFATLFMPTFIEVEGQIFLPEFAPKPVDWLDNLAADVRRLRADPQKLKAFVDSFNWLEVPYLFMNSSGTEEDYRPLAAAIAASWDARLRQLYPEYRFQTRIVDPEETGDTVGVGFERLD